MKEIKVFEQAIENQVKSLADEGINGTMFWAYRKSIEVGNDTIDFNECIWENEVEQIVNDCRKYDIDTITISSNFSSLNKILWELVQRGCTIDGMKEVNAPYKSLMSDDFEKIPALIIKL